MIPDPNPLKLKTFISIDYDEDEFDNLIGSIVGTKESLEKLKSAIDEALENGEASFGEEKSCYSEICKVKVKDESYFKESEGSENEILDSFSISDFLFIALILLSLGVGVVQIIGWVFEFVGWIFG